MKKLLFLAALVFASGANAETDCTAVKKEAANYCSQVFPLAVDKDMHTACVAEVVKSEHPECEKEDDE
jgi:NADPH-dependent curcumin reductase CurA